MASIYCEFGFDNLADWMCQNGMKSWAKELPEQVEHGLSHNRYGDLKTWLDAMQSLPEPGPTRLNADSAIEVICSRMNDVDKKQLANVLEALIPWRKGPFNLCGIEINAEWRSDWKWTRLKDHISPLDGRLVLDVGCGNGYHMWRMLGNGAARVIGIDPSPRFSIQFEIVKRLAGSHYPINIIPTPVEALPRPMEAFDSLFSMGVIYHRRAPQEHILELKDCLRPGGEIILESLVVSGDATTCLVPESRYAKMRNVWAIPSSQLMQAWLEESGFVNVRLIDESPTTTEEQRSTDWMRFESLQDFLDPQDISKTIEGYPAPRRAIVVAEKSTK